MIASQPSTRNSSIDTFFLILVPIPGLHQFKGMGRILSSDEAHGKPVPNDFTWIRASQRLMREGRLFRSTGKAAKSPVPGALQGELTFSLAGPPKVSVLRIGQ